MTLTSEQVMNNEWMPNDRAQGMKKNLWNIFHATSTNIIGIFSCHMDSMCLPCHVDCDMEKYFMMRPKIVFHVEKGLTRKDQRLFQSLYLFVQMVFLICNIKVGGFEEWKC